MSTGKALFSQVSEATGLPQGPIQKELHQLLDKHGLSANQLTLDDLRVVMADYLQEVLLGAQDAYTD